ncbi:MAG TPA: DNA polymerase IV [Candidatus Saccharimonadales bacterium]|jgi:DNA polymerase-4|nr:DNA polymerase IV [Candidatus Saccharimonadales bacterium]
MGLPSKTIFHVDMDAFFVSVEELQDPSLQGKAVVVGGKRDERGVVSAASYEARKFGVHSAMPLRTAAKLCPHAIFLDGHPDLYREYSRKARAVLEDFSPAVEMASIDEAYIDMTGSEKLLGPPLLSAHKLHQKMKERTGLNCSVGIGSSRLMAKIASGQAKPNGILFVLPGQEQSYLAPLDVGKIPGVGKVTKERLNQIGIHKVGDVLRMEESVLRENFGKWGTALAGKARGEDAGAWFEGEVGEESQAKSISHEHTFDEDTRSLEKIESTLTHLCEKVGRRLREQALAPATLQLKLRYSDFTTLTRAHSLPRPTQVDGEIFQEVRKLFLDNWEKGRAVRLLGVHASNFQDEQGQMDLLGDDRHTKWTQALSATDRLRDKFGDSAVFLAKGMSGSFRERVHENPEEKPVKPRPGKPSRR